MKNYTKKQLERSSDKLILDICNETEISHEERVILFDKLNFLKRTCQAEFFNSVLRFADDFDYEVK